MIIAKYMKIKMKFKQLKHQTLKFNINKMKKTSKYFKIWIKINKINFKIISLKHF